MSASTPISIGTGILAGAMIALAFLQSNYSFAGQTQTHSSQSSVSAQLCGNGTVDAPREQCDDGGNSSGDGCSVYCTVEGTLLCGNGEIDPGEECDDTGQVSGDGCTELCMSEDGYCGDKVVQAALGEQCDDGNEQSGDGCSFICLKEAGTLCGDGILQPDSEQCDTGSRNADAPSTCRGNCLLPRCGDGILDLHEGCDDGNRLAGDGCSSACRQED